MDNKDIVKIIGWIGSISYMAAYLLLSLNKIRVDRRFYHVLNIIGALCLITDAIYLKDYPNLAVNIVWACIAFFAVYGIQKQQRS